MQAIADLVRTSTISEYGGQDVEDVAGETLKLTRREALTRAMALVGGSMTAAELVPLAQALTIAEAEGPRFLSTDEMAILERAVDIIIPQTDTPGASAAGVHVFIDGMMADWANEESQQVIRNAIAQIDRSARDGRGTPFVELDDGGQIQVLETIDRAAYGESPEAQPPFRLLKSMTLAGYYTSEIGASVELRYNPTPGPSPGCIPFEEGDRAWYKHGGF